MTGKKKIIMIILYVICIGTICYGCRDIRIEEIKGSKEVMKDVQVIKLQKNPKENYLWTFKNEEVEIRDENFIQEIVNEILNCKIKQMDVNSYMDREKVKNGAAYTITLFSRDRIESVTIDRDLITLSFIKNKKYLFGRINQLKQGVETYKPRVISEGIDLEVFEKHFREKEEGDNGED